MPIGAQVRLSDRRELYLLDDEGKVSMLNCMLNCAKFTCVSVWGLNILLWVFTGAQDHEKGGRLPEDHASHFHQWGR